MRVTLLNPPISQNTTRIIKPVVKNLFYNSAPLGLCYLAAVLKENNHEVKIIDAAVECLPIERVIRRIEDFSPHLVGITTFTSSKTSVYTLTREIKTRFPLTKIVIGGPHITSNPEDLLEHPEIDVAVIGEGEITFKELIESVESGQDITKVKGLAYRVNNRVIFTPPREFIPDLDILPFPARDLVPLRMYKPQPNDQNELPKLSMISSRGCPYSCVFCDKNVFKNIYRSFTPGYIVKEMSHLVKDFGARDIAFIDSTFTSSKNRVYEILKEIKKADLNVTWTCCVRADVLDQQLLKEMKEAGCWRVRLGVESGNEDVLNFIKKGITKQQVRRVANWAYELDLQPKGFFMIGHLIDTKQTIEETINFACSLPLKDITVQINTPLKNTPQYQLAEEYGRIISRDFSEYNFFKPVFLPNGLTYTDIFYYHARFYLKFYLRPTIWYRHIRKIRSFADIVKYLKGACIVFFFFISWLKEKF
jgi:anaerobic magnesium-protoporphyrin IX monomethyl ester cyclase